MLSLQTCFSHQTMISLWARTLVCIPRASYNLPLKKCASLVLTALPRSPVRHWIKSHFHGMLREVLHDLTPCLASFPGTRLLLRRATDRFDLCFLEFPHMCPAPPLHPLRAVCFSDQCFSVWLFIHCQLSIVSWVLTHGGLSFLRPSGFLSSRVFFPGYSYLDQEKHPPPCPIFSLQRHR